MSKITYMNLHLSQFNYQNIPDYYKELEFLSMKWDKETKLRN